MQKRSENIPLLTIVRGFPGSGKTTFGRKLAAKTGAIFIEPDALLVQGGQYKYSTKRYFYACLQCKIMIQGIIGIRSDCIYADVLPTIQDVKLLLPPDIRYGYRIDYIYKVIDIPKITFEEAKARNVHNVCEEDLKRMFEQWEDWK